ncbi:MAG: hypothetical protein JW953_21670 [Anaerolineae bacterium]|nr:hypothetical protein [Anaerolineae bacterium]
MTSQDSWSEIKKRLSQLHADSSLIPFYPFLDKLQVWVEAQVYPENIFNALIWLIQEMSVQVEHGLSIHDVLDQVISGGFTQPDWSPENVHQYQTNGHIFQFVFSNFRDEIEPHKPDPGIPVPIVLLVMNDSDIEDLVTEKTLFKQLQKVLNKNGITDWTQRYRDKPEAWQPFSGTDGAESITHLVAESLEQAGNKMHPFIPVFHDIRKLNDTGNRHYLRTLRQEGCIVIMDSISIRHPAIFEAFQQSMLDAYPKTSVVTIAPFHTMFEVVRSMTVVFRLRISDMEFVKRNRDYAEDFSACREICEKEEFQHWLADRLRIMYPEIVGPTGIRAYMHEGLTGVGQ